MEYVLLVPVRGWQIRSGVRCPEHPQGASWVTTTAAPLPLSRRDAVAYGQVRPKWEQLS